jgi:4a-hydroxytetrahydrobiopterin dehydratase
MTLNIDSVEESLMSLKGWVFEDNTIYKEYTFKNYMDSIRFIQVLAKEAEKKNHHPDMIVGWCKIKVSFTSHDKGGVTEKCIAMARVSEKIKF